MARLSIYAVAAALAIVAGAVTAQHPEPAEPSAALRGGRTLQAQGPNTFFAPRVSGFRVDYCLG